MVAILYGIPNNVGLIKFYCINNPENKRRNKFKKKKKATSGEYSDASLQELKASYVFINKLELT